MPRARSPVRPLAVGAWIAVVACSASDPQEGAPATRADAATTPEGPADGGDVGAPGDDAPSSGACATREKHVIVATDDVGPGTAQCAGSISTGDFGFFNLGTGVAMFRFQLDPAMADAIRAGRTAAARLSLTYDPAPGVATIAGTVAVHVMRNDWVEGVSTTTYGGADMCRRTDGNPGLGWGAADAAASGATRIAEGVDYGPPIGSVAFDAAAAGVEIVLVRDALAADWTAYAGASATQLSLFVEETQDGKLVVASSDHASLPKPTLTLDVCAR